MKKTAPPASPDAYVAALAGWRRELVVLLRAAARGSREMEEVVKWGHLVYLSGGPVLLIRAEEHRVLFGFWRGQRMLALEPRLRGSGGYEMATIVFTEGDSFTAAAARRLVREAVALNQRFGDPTKDAPKRAAAKPARKAASKPGRKPAAKPARKTAAKRGRAIR